MKARGRRPSAFFCFECFSNETIRNYVVTCFSNQTMINYAVLHFCLSPKKHVYMHDELLLCSWRPTMSEEGALSVRVREPKTFCDEEELVEKAVPSSTKYKNKWALSVLVNGNLLGR